MVAKVLTMQSVERHKPQSAGRVEIPDAALPGFYLVVQPSGAKSWAVRYRFGGKTRKFTIGPYPLFDLGSARAAAREALQMAARGRDPVLEKKAAVEAAQAAERDTVRVIAAEYVERHLKPNSKPRYAAEAEALLRNHVVARWGDRRIGEITRKDAIALTDALTDAGMGVGANRVFSAARALFNWALEREVIETTPFLRLKPPLAEASRDRVLSDAEVRLVWRAADRIGYPFGTLVQLLLLTAQRRDEVARMTWAEVDADGLWTLPAARTKNSREHLVPLPFSACEILVTAPRIAGRAGFVLTTDGATASSNFAKNKAKLDAVIMEIARQEAVDAGHDPEGVDFAPWRLHDLRRTGSTGMARLRQPIHVTEAVLNHATGAVSGVAAVYNKYQYLDEKRAALEAWAAHVGDLTGGTQ
ncbi:integrase arm-type DNA-binding domain-containing protein [Methylobacterium sp. J-001]|uniref:tyrosine-type recombinase/integrase n=1 Tax=Methylobacterium sp. J-001 TaxID=2836609 RepID=UPI001FB8BF74|nr:site-specific integrase [Methylobacterium sp. J-001]MCJ2117655.1 integrase arm-type DNA-binding domain-containing protein [Methylobacterium sp. J-001]